MWSHATRHKTELTEQSLPLLFAVGESGVRMRYFRFHWRSPIG
jgi:hypothetical protein